uniref:S1 motif domain-containing protein n=1 Tax=viral metagenome TaxID=1070528 RepID=A0A6C0B0N5_9ZZZZ
MSTLQKPRFKKKQQVENSIIFNRSLITRSIALPIVVIGKNIQETIEKFIIENYEGKCVVEGLIKRGSCKIITYSSGLVKGTNIGFEVVFECQICCPVEGMLIQCIAKNITKAGIRAESSDETPSPIVVFISRDHYYMAKYFSKIQEGEKFTARVIGQRFELNDTYVSIIAELVEPKKDYTQIKPKLLIEE